MNLEKLYDIVEKQPKKSGFAYELGEFLGPLTGFIFHLAFLVLIVKMVLSVV